jgi:ribosome-binding protein aMBF1 (putative translation factor)
MSVHFIQDLGQDSLIKPYAAAEAVCGRELAEAHEIVAPEADADVCPECLTWAKRNRYQSRRCAVEMSARPEGSEGEAALKRTNLTARH